MRWRHSSTWPSIFTRSHVFLSLPAVLGLYWLRDAERRPEPRERLLGLLPLAGICLGGVALLLAFNAVRFGDPFENGVSYHVMHETFRARYQATGYFDLSYLPRNLEAMLLLLPRPIDAFPYLSFSPQGLSLFVATPLYLFLFRSLRHETRRLAWVLWSAVLPPLIPILLLMGTGELQFGHRYSADLQVFGLLLCALGMGGRVGPLAITLAALSIAMNTLGAFWFVSRYA